MQESVEYLGYRIDAQGVHTTAEKVQAIQNAPVPNNVQQLKSSSALLWQVHA